MIFSVSPYIAKILEKGDKKMAKKVPTKVLCCLVVCTILMSMVSLLAFTVGDTVTAQHDLVYALEGTELGYDDGEVDGIAPMAPHGPAVLFENNRKLDILGIKICGVRFGNVSRSRTAILPLNLAI
jgi:hypothetical protein